jgi:hypothetical protein
MRKSVSPEQGKALDGFCRALLTLQTASDRADAAALNAGLAAAFEVEQCACAPEGPVEPPVSSWRAIVLQPEYGAAVVMFEDGDPGAQQLYLELNPSRQLISGIWGSLEDATDVTSVRFDFVWGARGWELCTYDGPRERRVLLGVDSLGATSAPPGRPVTVSDGDSVARDFPSADLLEVLGVPGLFALQPVGTTSSPRRTSNAICGVCGKENPPENLYCGACGSLLGSSLTPQPEGRYPAERRCSNPQCGRAVRPGENFCPSCGSRVS